MTEQRDREKKTIYISQKRYIEKILQWFGMEDCKPMSIPLATDTKLLQSIENDTSNTINIKGY